MCCLNEFFMSLLPPRTHKLTTAWIYREQTHTHDVDDDDDMTDSKFEMFPLFHVNFRVLFVESRTVGDGESESEGEL